MKHEIYSLFESYENPLLKKWGFSLWLCCLILLIISVFDLLYPGQLDYFSFLLACPLTRYSRDDTHMNAESIIRRW